MSHPIIILGAGASNDYSSLEGRKLPLTSDIFDPTYSQLAARYFDKADTIATQAYRAVRRGENIEMFLTEFKKENEDDIKIQKEFIAFEFYLHYLFKFLSNPNKSQPHQNSYQVLVRQLELYSRKSNEPCTVLTFNYDLLIEKALNISKEARLDAYISDSISLIKLHGSADWGYMFPIDEEIPAGNEFEFYYEHAPLSDQFRSSNTLYPKRISGDSYALSGNGYILYPAIALPVGGKTEFVCPTSHLSKLNKAIKETDRILIIGWKAGDEHLLKLIKENFINKKIIKIVTRKTSSSTVLELKEKFSNIPGVVEVSVSGQQGFSNFLDTLELKEFLERDPLNI